MEGVTIMSKAWTDKNEYKRLSGELAISEDREFERRVLPLIRVIWPDAVGTPALRSFDRSGADHIVWSDTPPFSLVVQCKGFKVHEHELGNSQIEQCRKSISSFQKSGIKARKYILIHNRDARNEKFRIEIERELSQLVETEQVDQAELWDRQRILREAFNKILEQVRDLLSLSSSNARPYYAESQICEPLEQVPLMIYSLDIDQYRLIRESTAVLRLANPSKELLCFDDGNLLILIGQAGYGKTTAVLRSMEFSDNQLFYVPAATISKEIVGAKDLFQECIRLEELFAGTEDQDRLIRERLLRPVMELILKDESIPVVLILDGLDESIYFSRSGGLQQLFNQMRDVRVPIILTARAEFWHQRKSDFMTSYGMISQRGDRRLIKVKLIELLPWEKEQISLFAKRYRDNLINGGQQKNIDDFIAIIESDEYDKLYGDIPKRPLFLSFILEMVADRGVHHTGRAKLFYDWAQLKITRDIAQPMRWGNIGREPILSNAESMTTTLNLSFRAMMLAASCMVVQESNALELLPSCSVDEVKKLDEELKRIVDPTGLFLHSLLVCERKSNREPLVAVQKGPTGFKK